MAISTFDLFKIGVGPSSSHTVGPMLAARDFARGLGAEGLLARVHGIGVELFGSLGATGKGHGTDKAIVLGLEGHAPDEIEPDHIASRLEHVRSSGMLRLDASTEIGFSERDCVRYLPRQRLPLHSNAMRLSARDTAGELLLQREYYSVGGGFVVDAQGHRLQAGAELGEPPHAFASARQLLEICAQSGQGIAQVMWRNECAWRSHDEVRSGLARIRDAMVASIARGCATQGSLPGPMGVRRRASELYRQLKDRSEESLRDPLCMLDWVNLYAMAVNEENAAGGRIVTAPTNGAAGIVPAVLQYYRKFVAGADERGEFDLLLTAAAIGLLYKQNASISGAEVGCQGEVGVACSMAAAGLAAALGGSPEQVENAAEIGMEHNLGMTCDPVGGMVQIPCIERNAMGAVKAVNAARMALRGNGAHYVSLDNVIRTMLQTGADMKTKYKETSRGGLAVNVIEC